MGFISRLFKMSRRSKLPRLRHHLTNGRKLDEVDEETHLLMEAGLVRDWTGGRELMTKHNKSARDLFWKFSKKAKPNWRKRLHNQIIRMMGGLPYDPHKAELKNISKGIYDDGTYSRAHRINPRVGPRDSFPQRRK